MPINLINQKVKREHFLINRCNQTLQQIFTIVSMIPSLSCLLLNSLLVNTHQSVISPTKLVFSLNFSNLIMINSSQCNWAELHHLTTEKTHSHGIYSSLPAFLTYLTWTVFPSTHRIFCKNRQIRCFSRLRCLKPK